MQRWQNVVTFKKNQRRHQRSMFEAAVEEDEETALQRRTVQRWRAYAKRRAQHSQENERDAWGFAGGDGVTCRSLLPHPSSGGNGSGTAGGAKERDAWGFASPRRNKKKGSPPQKKAIPPAEEARVADMTQKTVRRWNLLWWARRGTGTSRRRETNRTPVRMLSPLRRSLHRLPLRPSGPLGHVQ